MTVAERLEVRPLGPEHAELLFESLQDRRIYAFIPESPPISVAALRVRYAALAAGPGGGDDVWRNWVMFERASGDPVGTLQATIRPASRRALVAYVVFPPRWGQGLATAGLAWLLAYLGAREGIDTAEAWVDPRNEASVRVLRRLSFEHTETVRDGDACDHVFSRAVRSSPSCAANNSR